MEDRYVAITVFEDLQDNNKRYIPGMIYPREGIIVSKERLQGLSTTCNNQGRQLIAKLIEQEMTDNDSKSNK